MFFYTSGKYNRPKIKLEIYRVDNKIKNTVWNVFRKYHYLNTNIHKASECYVAMYNNQLVGFISVMQSIGHTGIKTIHRLVVLPDYQGIGIGTSLLNFVGGKYKESKMKANIVTSNPSIYHSLKRSDKWKLLRIGRVNKQSNKAMRKTDSSNRITYTFQYK